MSRIRRSILRILRPTAKTQDLRMKREAALRKSWKADLLIRSAIFIRIRRGFIPGGPIVSEPVRKKNAGWRIDYFCVSESLQPRLKDAVIHTEIMGSDHCPVELDTEQL